MMDWLFKFDSVPQGDSISLGWIHLWPIWLWTITIILVAIFSIWCYRRNRGDGLWRFILPINRFLILILVALIINGPVIESMTQNRTPDQIILMIDRSGSMETSDVEDPRSGRLSRHDHVMTMLDGIDPELTEMSDDRSIRWFGFHGHAYEKSNQDNRTTPEFNEKPGRNTRIGYSLDQALSTSSGIPTSAVILFSDGRSHGNTDQQFTSRIRSRGVPIIVVPVGSGSASGDIGINQVVSPQIAFTEDRVPVQVSINRRGSRDSGFDLVLVDREDERELDRIHVDAGEESTIERTLLGIPDEKGSVTWRVVIEPEGDDLVVDNNSTDIDINLLQEPLRVLYVEGVPRWEYRYLKNLLLREDSIESSIMLLSADRSFAQEGDRPISRLPVTAGEFDDFDVVIIGDVPAGVMSPDQHHLLQESVASGGTGVLWIGGEESTPRTWGESNSASLLPFTQPFDLPAIGSPIQMKPTEEAERIGVLRLDDGDTSSWPAALTDEKNDWSKIQWSQWIPKERLKPTSSVLAETVRFKDNDENIPIVIDSRYGLGRSIYVATDDIWRWRYGRGERLGEQFWIQLIRLLGRSSLSGNESTAEFTPSRRQVPAGQVVRLKLRIMDESLISVLDDSMIVSIDDVNGRRVSETVIQRDRSDPDTWNGSWITTEPGEFEFHVVSDGLDMRTDIRVEDSSMEFRNPEVDHESLEQLARITNGHVVETGNIDRIFDLIPDRSITEIDTQRTTLWDAPFIFVLMMGLLLLEWIGRRLHRMA
tara:strand:+ start:11841 stop:14132 length:2292 start_codon:yes stop_codon:yes gene_type:complete